MQRNFRSPRTGCVKRRTQTFFLGALLPAAGLPRWAPRSTITAISQSKITGPGMNRHIHALLLFLSIPRPIACGLVFVLAACLFRLRAALCSADALGAHSHSGPRPECSGIQTGRCPRRRSRNRSTESTPCSSTANSVPSVMRFSFSRRVPRRYPGRVLHAGCGCWLHSRGGSHHRQRAFRRQPSAQ